MCQYDISFFYLVFIKLSSRHMLQMLNASSEKYFQNDCPDDGLLKTK